MVAPGVTKVYSSDSEVHGSNEQTWLTPRGLEPGLWSFNNFKVLKSAILGAIYLIPIISEQPVCWCWLQVLVARSSEAVSVTVSERDARVFLDLGLPERMAGVLGLRHDVEEVTIRGKSQEDDFVVQIDNTDPVG